MKFHLAILLLFFFIFIFPVSAKEFCVPDGICDSFCSSSFPDPDCPGGAQQGGSPGTQPPGGSPGTQPPGSGGGGFTLQNPIQAENFTEVMRRVANIAALIGLPIVVIMIIWTGAQFVFAGGDEKKLTAAKQSFYWTIIGALLVLGAYVIAAAIENFARQL